MGGLGTVAFCHMRGFPNAFGQTMWSDLQADISSVQLVAARSDAGFVIHLATCHFIFLHIQWLHDSKTAVRSFLYILCFGLRVGIHAIASSLPLAYRQSI